MSSDPALGEYIPSPGGDISRLPGIGGIYNTVNMHVYHYAGNNPVRYTDPDGRIIANVTAKGTQNSSANAALPLGNNNQDNAYGMLGCFCTAVMNIGNTIQTRNSGDTRTNRSAQGYSNNTKYFEKDKKTGFLDNLNSKGVSSLLTDVTGESFAVARYGFNTGDDPVAALEFFNNSSAEYFIVADVGGAGGVGNHFVNVLGYDSESGDITVFDTFDRFRDNTGEYNGDGRKREYSRENINSIYVIYRLNSNE